MPKSSSLVLFCFFIVSCTEKLDSPLVIGISPWAGYEFLYLAEQKGFFADAGMNVRITQVTSLSDIQRAYLGGRIDGMASTLVEVVHVSQLGDKRLNVILIPDYSNGGDVIIASIPIATVSDLKGKKVGCEIGSLGIYTLHRALSTEGLTLDDVTLVNTDQLGGEEEMLAGNIDAFISSPPISIHILKHRQFQKIFSSAEIPFEIIDTVSVSVDVLKANPDIVMGMRDVWQRALDFTRSNTEEAYKIMVEREGLTSDEFRDTLSGLIIVDKNGQEQLFDQPQKTQDAAIDVCKVLVSAGSLTGDCNTLPNIVYHGSY